jgi:hypothetical protein
MAGVKRGGAAGKKGRGGAGRKLARPSGSKYGAPMLKLLKLAVLLGLVAGFLFLLPFGGRTLADRWRAATGAEDFAYRTWAEMRGATPRHAPMAPGAPGAPKKARAGKAPAGASGPADQPATDQPLETTTEADRKALDQLLDQHLADKPKR